MTYYNAWRTALSAVSLTTLAILAGCQTTQRAQMATPRPAMLNSSPSDTSEMKIADTALRGGNIQMAGSIYERELAAHPDSIEALQGLADSNYIGGDTGRARPLYERADVLSKGARGPRLGLARVALREHRFADAIAMYEPLVKANPADAVSWAGLGSAWDLSGNHRKAQEAYRTGLAASPGDMALRSNLGLSLVLDGEEREGANQLLDIAGSSSAPPQARQNLALAYGVLGNDEAASRILSMDLPKASVADNLRYYDAVRALLAVRPAFAPTPKLGAAVAGVRGLGAMPASAPAGF
jgi:Flp pilus assembly protein TadD